MIKNILIIIVGVAALIGAQLLISSREEMNQVIVEDATGDINRISLPADEQQQPQGKIKADMFSGKLEEVDEGCYVDGECFVVVSGKHVTVVLGWRQEVVGQVLGVESFADLKAHIGKEIEVYAQDKNDGTYTLYGSEGFYVKVK